MIGSLPLQDSGPAADVAHPKGRAARREENPTCKACSSGMFADVCIGFFSMEYGFSPRAKKKIDGG